MSLPSNRYLAVDVLRGLTVALMIVVNMSISETLSFGQLLHSTWNGLTATDVVFPTFLFVVGASMGFAQERYAAQGLGHFARKVGTRAALIFLLGFIVSNFPFLRIVDGQIVWTGLHDLRIMGVLQRIALAYTIASLVTVRGKAPGALIFSLVVLVLNVIVPALFGNGTLAGSAALKLDLFVFGASHLYQGDGVPYDPEGLLGTLPSAVNVLAGYMAIQYLRHHAVGRSLTVRDLISPAAFGAALILLAVALQGSLPLNKKLWTSTFVLCTVGIDLIVLAALVLSLDIWKLRGDVSGYCEVFGKNALAIYMMAELLMSVAWTVMVVTKPMFMWIYDEVFAAIGTKWASLVYALVFMQLCWSIAWILDKKRVYIRL
ncbi:MAG: heparan-alpha-glucosaminide N-acetyltransferase domain-containing protein [Asticcacaulis sp.]|uniref:acyltransferase family protein n=1 Tax=Asticcacaulis sp. TaxID=1872648 RepID=UPI0039E319C5